jgi:DNA-binding NtrC family response regulator
LAVIQIDIPRLADRGDDVLLLAQHFVAHGPRTNLPKITGLSPETEMSFRCYSWPGNVRELRNVIERALILEDSDTISTCSLPFHIVPQTQDETSHRLSVIGADATIHLPSQGISLDQLETSLLKQALAQASGNQTRAADLLGLTRDQFRYRLKKLREAESSRHLSLGAAA